MYNQRLCLMDIPRSVASKQNVPYRPSHLHVPGEYPSSVVWLLYAAAACLAEIIFMTAAHPQCILLLWGTVPSLEQEVYARARGTSTGAAPEVPSTQRRARLKRKRNFWWATWPRSISLDEMSFSSKCTHNVKPSLMTSVLDTNRWSELDSQLTDIDNNI